jgi:hypothetical protein
MQRAPTAIAALAAIAIVAALPFGSRSTAQPIGGSAESQFLATYCSPSSATAIPTGSEAEARAYYASLGTIGLSLTIPPNGASTPSSKLDDILTYLGYAPAGSASQFSAQQLQDLEPRDLMDPGALSARLGIPISSGDVLVARFFAPKISDVSVTKVSDVGWRRLVRLRSQPGSSAAAHSIEYAVVLFNFFSPIIATNPFAGANSVNTQVILVSNDPKRALYWVDFGPTKDGALLSFALNAFFDAGHLPSSTPTKGAAEAYHVPCGCIACHGGMRLDFNQKPPAPEPAFTTPVLDYLDTDHWNDRIQSGDDFAGLAAPILIDAGTYNVIQALNIEFERQNSGAQPDSVLRRGAEHWITTHMLDGPQPKALFDRALKSPLGPAIWDRLNPVDAELLPKLNRYCFRCHGSVKFDIFDKEMVLRFRTSMKAALFPRNQIGDPRKAMPPDRTLSDAELKSLRDLLSKL